LDTAKRLGGSAARDPLSAEGVTDSTPSLRVLRTSSPVRSTGTIGGVDLRDFVDRYLTEVYVARDAEAARRFIADPCLRHEHGELVVLSLDDNIARIRGFLDQYPGIEFTNRLVVADAGHVVAVADFDLGNGHVLSAVEAFKVVDGKITETWNTKPAPGAWG
jgi:hypothetical protein